MDFTRKLSFLVFVLCVLISLRNQNAKFNRKIGSAFQNHADHSSAIFRSLLEAPSPERAPHGWLVYDYYNESCPSAERIIRSTAQKLFELNHDFAPGLLRLVFHDCFVEGCDASVLLDPADEFKSEKLSIPNESLKGFDVIDTIKSLLEEECPGVVSCADILVLAAREAVLLAGGPFYPLLTGRKDSRVSYGDKANYELPRPQDDLSQTIHSFATRGFDERETVSLLGGHSTGTIHCKFFMNRLYNFNGKDPDDSIDPEFLELLRSKCNGSRHHSSASPSVSPSFSPSPSSAENSPPTASPSEENPGVRMDYEGPGMGFGTLYYRSLLQGKGLLFADQQMTAGEATETWVLAYASDTTLFHRDFGLSMIKLSNLRVKNEAMGQVRLNCRKVN